LSEQSPAGLADFTLGGIFREARRSYATTAITVINGTTCWPT